MTRITATQETTDRALITRTARPFGSLVKRPKLAAIVIENRPCPVIKRRLVFDRVIGPSRQCRPDDFGQVDQPPHYAAFRHRECSQTTQPPPCARRAKGACVLQSARFTGRPRFR